MPAPFGRSRIGSDRPTPLSRRFTYRYLIAIAAFVAIGAVARVGEGRALDQLSRNAEQLEAASAQPTRVYRIYELAQRIDAQPDAADTDTVSSQLSQEVNTLRIVQRALSTGEGGPGLPAGTPSEALRELYFGTDTRLDQDITDIANAGQAVADLAVDTEQAAVDRATLIELIESSLSTTLGELDRAVRLYTAENSAIIDQRRDQAMLLLAAEVGVVLVVVLALFRPMARSIHQETSQLEDAERIHRENNERQTFRNDMTKALEVTDTEVEVLAAVERALVQVVPKNKAEVMLADSSQAHLRKARVHPVNGGPGCPVDGPQSCAALRSSQRMVFESSRMLNVCPKLPEHTNAPCSAVCVPVTFNGQTMGVLHVTGPDNQPPSPTQIERLTVMAGETGARLGHLRVMAMTQLQASTDGLTGLLNRRSLEAKARSLMLDKTPFSLAIADLDDFKKLNDTHGHEAGDRALRQFASSLRKHLRPDDVACRYGGEEFVILLPNTGLTEAVRALNRLQTSIADDNRRAGGAPFTVSWGLTDSSAGERFEDTVAEADALLYQAKRSGKNCVVVDSEAARAANPAIDDALSAIPSPDVPTGDGSVGRPEVVELDLDQLL